MEINVHPFIIIYYYILYIIKLIIISLLGDFFSSDNAVSFIQLTYEKKHLEQPWNTAPLKSTEYNLSSASVFF